MERDLDLLRLGMDIVASHWLKADTELRDIDTRVKTLRDDHVLQMKIRSLKRAWEDVEKDYMLYMTTVRRSCMKKSSTYSLSAQHTPEQQSRIQAIGSFKARDNCRSHLTVYNSV